MVKNKKPATKRAKLALRFFTYGVMTVATIALTVLAIFYAMGYRFNQNNFNFEQGGLMQFRSLPEGARVTIDGEAQSFNTPGRSNKQAGQHTIQMQLNGYKDWAKTVSLEPGQLLWLNYARLIPKEVKTSALRSFDKLENALFSPDRRWLILQEDAKKPQFVLADVANVDSPKFTNIAIPESKLTKKNGKIGTIKLIEWDLGSDFLLLEHTNGSSKEFIRLESSKPDEAVNLSQVFGLKIAEAHFAGTSPNIVYIKTDKILHRLDVGSKSASAALINGVKKFSIYGDDTVAYVAEREAEDNGQIAKRQVVGVLKGTQDKVLRTLPLNKEVNIAYTEYFRDSYLAFTTGDGNVQILRNVTEETNTLFARFEIDFAPKWLKFSNNGRMLTTGAGDRFSSYDLELQQVSQSSIGNESKRPLNWLDEYYLWSDAGDKLRIVEFDGTNGHDIASVAPGFGASLSQDNEFLFSIGKDKSKFTLQISDLVVD